MICGALAGGVHLVSARLNAAGGLQHMLIALDLLDPPPGWLEQQQRRREEEEAAAEAARRADEERTEPRPWWHHYLPLRKVWGLGEAWGWLELCSYCVRMCLAGMSLSPGRLSPSVV